MHLTKLELIDFKRVKKTELNLQPLNVIVGGNNSGKSSVLQGIHFFLTAALASREARQNTYTQEMLLFCPAYKFEDLGNETPYTNQSHKGYLTLYADLPDEQSAQYEICIYRGRNEGNVGCTRAGSNALATVITDSNKLFSVYVPGLAGIPSFEQYRTLSVVRRGVASGDANLYLRNVLLQIARTKKIPQLTKWMRTLFPFFELIVKFEPRRDLVIGVKISIDKYAGKEYSLELCGTGVLQALQIFSYVTLFEPQLLLLDEPDSHLHPDNQALLAKALRLIASQTSTQVIVSTHSRHLVDAFRDHANFIWLKNGKVSNQGLDLDYLPLLIDIGALNDFDKLKQGKIRWVFLSEDGDLTALKILTAHAGFDPKETLFYSYRGIANFETAISLAHFVKEVAPLSKVIIHRDRDFMTPDEAAKATQRISECGAEVFITEGSDIESYFTNPAHIAEILDIEITEVGQWLAEIAQANHTELQHNFTRKRDEIKRLIYKGNPNNCPDTLELLGNAIPLPTEKCLGKFILSKAHANMQHRFNIHQNLIQETDALHSDRLIAILNSAID